MPRLPDPRFAPDCTIELDGRPLPARRGESVAVALVAAGELVVARSPKYHRPRGAFCLSGSCHACLARVDGEPNQRLCRTPCRPGLRVDSQNALPTARGDLLGAIDLLYPGGLDHHHLATWSALANRAAVAVSRRLAGIGTLPERTPPPAPAAVEERWDALVIGAGPAGLGAAEALARLDRRVLLVESDRTLGGRLRAGLNAPGDPPPGWSEAVGRAVAVVGEVATGWTALGLWRDRIAVRAALAPELGSPRLRLVRAAAVVVATGSSALPPLVPRNDLPGIFAGRALARALAEDGAIPAGRCVVAGDGAEAALVSARLRAAGVEVLEARDVAAARGGRRLSGVTIAGGATVRCRTLAWCGPRAPASDLARQAGAGFVPDPGGGFGVRAGPAGATRAAGVWAAGEVVAEMSAAEAAAAGRRAGEEAGADG